MSFEAALDRLLAGVPGFGQCQRCGYRDTVSPALCSRCANRTLEPLAAPTERCRVCGHPYPTGTSECRNGPCSAGWREFDGNYPIAMRSGALKRTIESYKYDGRRAWAKIFGRILVGFLDANAATFEPFDPHRRGPDLCRDRWPHLRPYPRRHSRGAHRLRRALAFRHGRTPRQSSRRARREAWSGQAPTLSASRWHSPSYATVLPSPTAAEPMGVASWSMTTSSPMAST
jgi:predicted amidophosphoribosyltransferase